MQRIEFDEELQTGIDEIDEQHRQLIEIYNELVEALEAGKANRQMEEVLARLFRYTKQHFATEEGILEATEYPELDRHRRAHESLVLSLRKYVVRHRRNRERISKEMVDFVGRWIHHHIAEDDLAYAEHVRGARAGQNA